MASAAPVRRSSVAAAARAGESVACKRSSNAGRASTGSNARLVIEWSFRLRCAKNRFQGKGRTGKFFGFEKGSHAFQRMHQTIGFSLLLVGEVPSHVGDGMGVLVAKLQQHLAQQLRFAIGAHQGRRHIEGRKLERQCVAIYNAFRRE